MFKCPHSKCSNSELGTIDVTTFASVHDDLKLAMRDFAAMIMQHQIDHLNSYHKSDSKALDIFNRTLAMIKDDKKGFVALPGFVQDQLVPVIDGRQPKLAITNVLEIIVAHGASGKRFLKLKLFISFPVTGAKCCECKGAKPASSTIPTIYHVDPRRYAESCRNVWQELKANAKKHLEEHDEDHSIAKEFMSKIEALAKED